MKNTLYVFRPLLNGQEVYNWAEKSGFSDIHPPEKMHVTIAYSKEEVEWMNLSAPETNKIKVVSGKHSMITLGGIPALQFEFSYFERRWQCFLDEGVSYDFETYVPHISISYIPQSITDVCPFQRPLVFGGEEYEKVIFN